GFEERHQVRRTLMGLGDVLLHRPDGRAPEQADEGVHWHEGKSLRKRGGKYTDRWEGPPATVIILSFGPLKRPCAGPSGKHCDCAAIAFPLPCSTPSGRQAAAPDPPHLHLHELSHRNEH